jgi:hypothetical protein
MSDNRVLSDIFVAGVWSAIATLSVTAVVDLGAGLVVAPQSGIDAASAADVARMS